MRVLAIGRIGGFPRRSWERALAQQGGERVKHARSADLAVLGSGAASRGPERLRQNLADLQAKGVTVISERTFLRRLGLLPPLSAEPRAFSAEDLAERAKMPPNLVELLVLFDVVEGENGRFGFRALKAATEAARLLQAAALEDLVFACGRMRDLLGVVAPLSELSVATDPDGRFVLRSAGGTADLNGQFRLDIQGDSPSISSLLNEAEEARESGESERAVAALRRALTLAPQDLDVLFELGSLLCQTDDGITEGVILLRRATAIRPGFADAWYNLGHALEHQGRSAEAQVAYERAAEAEPTYADPLFNLGMMALEAGRYDAAVSRLERYLALDPGSEWAGRARKALALARLSRMKA